MNELRQLTLFNLQEVESVPSSNPVHDPYWDELEQEQSTEIAVELLYVPTALEPPFVQEQFFVDNNELGIFNHPWDGTLAPEQDDTVRAQVSLATQKSAPEHSKPAHWVEKYWVKRGENKYWYYRYRWMFGRKSYRVHLGSVLSPLVKEKVEMVRGAIALGKSPLEIKQLISSPVG